MLALCETFTFSAVFIDFIDSFVIIVCCLIGVVEMILGLTDTSIDKILVVQNNLQQTLWVFLCR